MTEAGKGVAAMVASCTIWGLSPLYYALLVDVPPLEVLAHRTLWSLLCFGVLLRLRRQAGWVRRCLGTPRRFILTALAAVMISANWGGFIFAVQSGRALESSLGYYMFPLVAVFLGYAVLKDRLRPLQWAAVALAFVAVSVLTLGLGVVPQISLALALTFGLYGLLKRRLGVDPMASVGAEVLLLAPIAAGWLMAVHLAGAVDFTGKSGAVFFADPAAAALLMLSGPLTGAPLILFAYASQRVILPTLGLIQYLNPTLQFGCAVLVFGEVVTRWHLIAFPLIWVGLAIYSLDNLRAARRAPGG